MPKSPKKNPKYDPSKRERKQSSRQSQNVVYVLSEFALELMRILEAFNTENFQSDEKLRIGTNLVLFSIFFIVVSPLWFSCYCYCCYCYTLNKRKKMGEKMKEIANSKKCWKSNLHKINTVLVYTLITGIAHGKVMAGVVGSSKPLYDVWGNAVNMSSRMDSTGEPGKIQLTKESAEELQSFGIRCDYRGETFVKGRGNIPTFDLDKPFISTI